MSDFAKIIRATDGGLVLFHKDNGDDGEPVLKQISEMDGITGALNLSFTDDDDGYDKRDHAFDAAAGVEQADAIRKAFRKFMTESPQ